MKEIIEDYRRENFTATDWLLSFVATIVFVLICGLVG